MPTLHEARANKVITKAARQKVVFVKTKCKAKPKLHRFQEIAPLPEGEYADADITYPIEVNKDISNSRDDEESHFLIGVSTKTTLIEMLLISLLIMTNFSIWKFFFNLKKNK